MLVGAGPLATELKLPPADTIMDDETVATASSDDGTATLSNELGVIGTTVDQGSIPCEAMGLMVMIVAPLLLEASSPSSPSAWGYRRTSNVSFATIIFFEGRT